MSTRGVDQHGKDASTGVAYRPTSIGVLRMYFNMILNQLESEKNNGRISTSTF